MYLLTPYNIRFFPTMKQWARAVLGKLIWVKKIQGAVVKNLDVAYTILSHAYYADDYIYVTHCTPNLAYALKNLFGL